MQLLHLWLDVVIFTIIFQPSQILVILIIILNYVVIINFCSFHVNFFLNSFYPK
jgi:hypothetical protein